MTLDRRNVLRAGGLALASAIAGCVGGNSGGGNDGGEGDGDGSTGGSATTTGEAGEDPSTADATVEMVDVSFSPVELAVETGATVRWVNRDSFEHDVVSAQFNDGAADWSLDTDTFGQGGSVTHTFESAGAHEYFCSVHGEGSMCGIVLVGGADPAGSLPCGGGGATTTGGDGGGGSGGGEPGGGPY